MQFLKFLCLICACILFAAGCAGCSASGGNEEAQGTTGYPSGTMQRQYLFANGRLYLFDDNLEGVWKELPEGFTYYGEIVKEDIYDFPDEELESSRIEPGSKVYANENDWSSVFVQHESGTYARFLLSEEE